MSQKKVTKKGSPKPKVAVRKVSTVQGSIKNRMASYASSGTTVHVVPRHGGWAVKSEGTTRAAKVHKGKTSAVAHGKDIAKKRSSNLVIHKKDGSFDKRIKPKTTTRNLVTKKTIRGKTSVKKSK